MFMRKGRQWANIPYNMEVRLDVDDKANSAGIVVDAISCKGIALDDGIGMASYILHALILSQIHQFPQTTDSA